MQVRPLPQHRLVCGKKTLDLAVPQVMGILNVTPDSFSDGGQFLDLGQAVAQARQLVAQGASIVDVGGESTRPHASAVSTEQELARVIPVVTAIAAELDTIISVDTSNPLVMQAAVHAGAHIWNDVRALTRPGALHMAAQLDIPVVLMHMRGEPSTMNQLAHYGHLINEITAELSSQVDAALQAGVRREQLIIDPGFGFAKQTAHNLQLLQQLYLVRDHFGLPLLCGLSRKRFLGEILGGAAATERLFAGLAGHFLCVQQGASIVRTHDVAETLQHLSLWQAMSHEFAI